MGRGSKRIGHGLGRIFLDPFLSVSHLRESANHLHLSAVIRVSSVEIRVPFVSIRLHPCPIRENPRSMLLTLFLRKSKGFLFARTYLGTNNANTRCFYQRSRTVTVLYQAVAQVLCKLVLT